jgi:hypothetical protein
MVTILGTPCPPRAPTGGPAGASSCCGRPMDEKRRQEDLTWQQLANLLECSPNQLTGLRTARFATGMDLAMRITQWIGRPAADFVYPARW